MGQQPHFEPGLGPLQEAADLAKPIQGHRRTGTFASVLSRCGFNPLSINNTRLPKPDLCNFAGGHGPCQALQGHPGRGGSAATGGALGEQGSELAQERPTGREGGSAYPVVTWENKFQVKIKSDGNCGVHPWNCALTLLKFFNSLFIRASAPSLWAESASITRVCLHGSL